MNITHTRWVFFVALMVLLPLPFYNGELAWLPVLRVLFIVSAEGYLALTGHSAVLDGLLMLSIFVLLWIGILWLLVKAFLVWTMEWPATIRGSVMGLAVFSLLITLSTIPVYCQLGTPAQMVTFFQVYQ